jgi:hypothetical protein
MAVPRSAAEGPSPVSRERVDNLVPRLPETRGSERRVSVVRTMVAVADFRPGSPFGHFFHGKKSSEPHGSAID